MHPGIIHPPAGTPRNPLSQNRTPFPSAYNIEDSGPPVRIAQPVPRGPEAKQMQLPTAPLLQLCTRMLTVMVTMPAKAAAVTPVSVCRGPLGYTGLQ